jgi:hypothetical protein
MTRSKCLILRWPGPCLQLPKLDVTGAIPGVLESERGVRPARNSIIRVGVLQFFIAVRFVNLTVSLPQYQFASHRSNRKLLR